MDQHRDTKFINDERSFIDFVCEAFSMGDLSEINKNSSFLFRLHASTSLVDRCHSIGGYPAIVGASENGELECVIVLVEELHADVNSICSVRGQTALHLAAQNGHVDVCEFLLEHGARVNQAGKWDVDVTKGGLTTCSKATH